MKLEWFFLRESQTHKSPRTVAEARLATKRFDGRIIRRFSRSVAPSYFVRNTPRRCNSGGNTLNPSAHPVRHLRWRADYDAGASPGGAGLVKLADRQFLALGLLVVNMPPAAGCRIMEGTGPSRSYPDKSPQPYASIASPPSGSSSFCRCPNLSCASCSVLSMTAMMPGMIFSASGDRRYRDIRPLTEAYRPSHAPAWIITGVPCGEHGTFSLPRMEKFGPLWSSTCICASSKMSPNSWW